MSNPMNAAFNVMLEARIKELLAAHDAEYEAVMEEAEENLKSAKDSLKEAAEYFEGTDGDIDNLTSAVQDYLDAEKEVHELRRERESVANLAKRLAF